MSGKRYVAFRWFRISVGVGLVDLLFFALPALFAPRFFESLLEVGTTNTVHWLQDTALLLIIIAVMYIPVILDPFRYIFISYLTVAGRFAAGVLFLIGVLYMDYPPGMRVLAANDLIISILQAVLLYYMLKAGDPRDPRT